MSRAERRPPPRLSRNSSSQGELDVAGEFVLSETVELPSGTECRDGSVRLNADGTFTYFYTRTLVAAEYTGVTEYTADGAWEWRATARLVCTPAHGSRSRTESHASGSSHATAEWAPQLTFDVVHHNPLTLLLRYKARAGGTESRVFVKRGPGEEVPASPLRPRRGTPQWNSLAAGADEFVAGQGDSDDEAGVGGSSGPSSTRHTVPGGSDEAGVGGGAAQAGSGRARLGRPASFASDVSGAGVTGAEDVVGRYVYHETVPYEVGTGSADGEVVFHTDGRFNYSYTRTREDTHYSGTTQRTAMGTYEVTSPGCVVCHPSVGRRKKAETFARDKPIVETGAWNPDLTFYSAPVADGEQPVLYLHYVTKKQRQKDRPFVKCAVARVEPDVAPGAALPHAIVTPLAPSGVGRRRMRATRQPARSRTPAAERRLALARQRGGQAMQDVDDESRRVKAAMVARRRARSSDAGDAVEKARRAAERRRARRSRA